MLLSLDTLTREQLTDAVERMTLALARATGAEVAVICLGFGLPIPTDPR